MLDLLQANAPIVSAAASLGTLCIWAVYLQIFVGGHRCSCRKHRDYDTGHLRLGGPTDRSDAKI